MTGAIEFLRKAKAICESKPTCHNCVVSDLCQGMSELTDESDIVRNVMDYRLEEANEKG